MQESGLGHESRVSAGNYKWMGDWGVGVEWGGWPRAEAGEADGATPRQPCLLPQKPGERLDDFKHGCDGIPAAF